MHSDLWYDEVYSYRTASMPFGQMLHSLLLGGDTNPPLYTGLLHFWLKLGDSDTHIKSLSLLFGLASIGIMFRLGKMIGGTRLAFLASFLLAVSGPAIRYSLEARPYSLFLFLTLVSTLLFLSAIKKSQDEPSQSATLRIWVWYGSVTTLAIYAHWFSLLLLPLHTLALVIYCQISKPVVFRFVWVLLIILCCCLPLLPFLLNQITLQSAVGGFSWCGNPNLHSLLNLGFFLAGGKNLFVAMPLVFLIACLAGKRAPSPSASISKNHWWFFGAYVFVPIILVSIISFSLDHYSFFVPRYFFPSIIGVQLLVAASLLRMNKKLALLFIVIFTLSPLVKATKHWRRPEKQYSRLAVELGNHSDKVVLHLTPMSYNTTLYYSHDVTAKQKVAWSESIGMGYVLNYNLKGAAINADNLVEIDSQVKECGEFFVVLDPIDGDPTIKQVESRLKNNPSLLFISEKKIGNLSLELFSVQDAARERK